MPESGIQAFCAELANHTWENIKLKEDVNEKVEIFHEYIRKMLDKHLPEKTVIMSDLDKKWMNPELKQLLRQTQRERLKKGKSKRFKKLWSKFRRLKRSAIKSNTNNVVNELKESKPGKWFSVMKKMGGIDHAAA